MSDQFHKLTRLFLMTAMLFIASAAMFAWAFSTGQNSRSAHNDPQETHYMSDADFASLPQSETQWQEKLTPQQYSVLRRKGTEPAFTGEYWNTETPGVYRCAGCGQPLFSSDTKFDSGTGWPSFYAPAGEQCVATRADNSLFRRRTEVVCSHCEGHLGHVFPDGPAPTGMRYCVNSAALELVEGDREETSDSGS